MSSKNKPASTPPKVAPTITDQILDISTCFTAIVSAGDSA